MSRKLTLKEKEEKIVLKVFNRIKTIEKNYGVFFTRRGCYKFYNKRGNELRLKREIKEKESQLNQLKSKSKEK